MENELTSQPSKTLERVLLSIIRWGIYASLFVPLIVSSKFFYSFIVPKTIYFRVFVEIIFGFYLILASFFPKYRPKINALSISVFIFVLVLMISSILGVDFQRSFWSVYERMIGLFTILHLYAFFLVLSNVFRTRKDWEKLFFISIFVGILCSFGFVSAGSIARGGGTIGNSSFFAAYLFFDIFFAIALFIRHKFSGLGIFSMTSLFIMIPSLLVSGARTASICFFGGLFLLTLLLLFFSKTKKFKIIAIITPIILIGIGLLLFFNFPVVRNLIISSLDSMEARYLVWEMAWKGFLERPILGWGLESFDVVFAKFFNPKLFLKEYGGEIWFDRAHNIVFDTLVSSGLVGFLSFLSVLFVSIFYLFKDYKKNQDDYIGLVMISLLVSYFIQNLLVFDMISSYVSFFFTLAFFNHLIKKDQTEEEVGSKLFNNKIMRNLVISLVFVFTSTCLYFGNIQPAQSATNIVDMIVSKNLTEQFNYYKKSLNTLRYNYELNQQFSSILFEKALQPNENKDLLKESFALLEDSTKNNAERNPLSFRPRLILIKLYLARYKVFNAKEDLMLAEKILNQVEKISPTNQQYYWLLADFNFAKDDFEESIKSLQKAIDLEPRNGLSHWYLVSYYNRNNQYEKALEQISIAEKMGLDWRSSLSVYQEVIFSYEGLGMYDEAILLYRDLVGAYPSNVNLWLRFAMALFNSGDKEEAKEAAQKAIQLNPELINQAGDTLKVLLQ